MRLTSSIFPFFLIFAGLTISTSISLKKIQEQELLPKRTSSANEGQRTFTHAPVRTDRNGKFVDYVVVDSPSVDGKTGGERTSRRRSASERLDAASATEDGNHEIFFDLGHSRDSPLSGARLHLKRHYKFVARNFVVEVRAESGKIVRRRNEVEDCHYRGVIHNHSGSSKVAVSFCNGLQGIILKDDEYFVIEPIKNHANRSSRATSSPLNEIMKDNESHPHVIVARSTSEGLGTIREDDDDSGGCGFADDALGPLPWWRIDPRSDVRKEKDQHSGRREKRDNHDHVTKHRRKRSVSRERNVETMVVADKLLVGYHGREAVERYILTIMNIVAALYHDASIGNAINIIVTRIVLLTEDQPDLEISHHGSESLKSFCSWQQRINVNGSSPADVGLAHHDNAILMTGFDICASKDAPCATLGIALPAGMCSLERSCSINEDTGLSTAFTIAHEIGHNFGMSHDGVNNPCRTDGNAPSRIMAPQLTKNARPFSWSNCSKDYITKFLDSGAADCLLDSPPQRDFVFPDEMPGQMHDADEQCRFQYGAHSRHCRIGDPCSELWCHTKSEQCVTNSVPAAEGTSCTTVAIQRGWCYRGECVAFGYRPSGIDGAWGDWAPWSDCSMTCGTGAASSSRSCDSPPPEHGGRYCIGQRKRYRTCNTQPCAGPPRDQRAEQCQRFDNEPYRGRYYNWIPYRGDDKNNPCALNCVAQGFPFYTELASAVIDGTSCFTNSLDICISGRCHPVGCDQVLHSGVMEDKCRVCGGDGSSCQTHSGVFRQPVSNMTYHDVVTIPRGSVKILVEELDVSQSNYIALASATNVEYINGNFTIDYPREFQIAGTSFVYKRSLNEPESLSALGPTVEDLVLRFILQEENRGLKYEFNVPVEGHGSGDGSESAFLWEHGGWTPCTVSCAGGAQQRAIECRRVDDGTVVQDLYCDRLTKPVTLERSCNLEPCPQGWFIGSWSKCSRSCGGGHRSRKVLCMRKMTQYEDEVVLDRHCSGSKPDTVGQCGTAICPPQWVLEPWSACRPSCGIGYKRRVVLCKSNDRRYTYTNESVCDLVTKPNTVFRCNNQPCPPPRWVAKSWGPCSVKCGQGQRRRGVACINPVTNTRSYSCSSSSMPRTIQACRVTCHSKTDSGRSGSSKCIDNPKVAYCPLVLKFNFCKRPYFRRKCCRTCSGT